ncbi:hypothetical protein HDU87_005159 [Geranomyces variabilis]|uniref:Structure-specific endonuclease subunit SLX4 n=1 Tax=Geranomyces variabilis TaxID=109894 RepID=A0AAD5XTH0_9FUNG|nr:hypothetical protein HDU87_005159 [Geranomyces variabilis]
MTEQNVCPSEIAERIVVDQDESTTNDTNGASVGVGDDFDTQSASGLKRPRGKENDEPVAGDRPCLLKRAKTELQTAAAPPCARAEAKADGESHSSWEGGLNATPNALPSDVSPVAESFASPRKPMAPFHFCMICGKDVGLTAVHKRLQHVRRCLHAHVEKPSNLELPACVSDSQIALEYALTPLKFCPFCKTDVRESRMVVAADAEAHLLHCPESVGQTLDHVVEFIEGLLKKDEDPPLAKSTVADPPAATTAPTEVPDPPIVVERFQMEQVCIVVDTDTEERWEPRIQRVPIKAAAKSKSAKTKATRQSRLIAVAGSLVASPKSAFKGLDDSKVTKRRTKKAKIVPVEYDLRYSRLEGRRRRLKEEPVQTVRDVSCARALVEEKIRIVLSLQPSHIEEYMRHAKGVSAPAGDCVERGKRPFRDTDSLATLWAIAALNDNQHSTRQTDLFEGCEFGTKASQGTDEPDVKLMQFTQEESKVARETEGRILTVMAVYDSEARDRQRSLEQEIAKLRKQHTEWVTAHTTRRNQEIEEIKLKSQARAIGIQQTRSLFARSATSYKHSAAEDSVDAQVNAVSEEREDILGEPANDGPVYTSTIKRSLVSEKAACERAGGNAPHDVDIAVIHQPWDPHAVDGAPSGAPSCRALASPTPLRPVLLLPPPATVTSTERVEGPEPEPIDAASCRASALPIPLRPVFPAPAPVTAASTELLVERPESDDDAACPSSPDLLDFHASWRSQTSGSSSLQPDAPGDQSGSRRREPSNTLSAPSPGRLKAISQIPVADLAISSSLANISVSRAPGQCVDSCPRLSKAHQPVSRSLMSEARSPIREANFENDNADYYGFEDGFISHDGIDYWPGDSEYIPPRSLSPSPQFDSHHRTDIEAYCVARGRDATGTPPPLPAATFGDELQGRAPPDPRVAHQPALVITDDDDDDVLGAGDAEEPHARWTQDDAHMDGVLIYDDDDNDDDIPGLAPTAVDLTGHAEEDAANDSDTSSDADESVPIDDRLFAYIRAQTALYSRILVYEALDMEALHAQVVSAKGLEKCSRKALGRFLDSKGINYVLPQTGKKGGPRRWK